MIGRETVSEDEIKYPHGRFLVSTTEAGYCARNITNDGSLSLNGLGMRLSTRHCPEDGRKITFLASSMAISHSFKRPRTRAR